jgi:hypothetical protein
MPPVFQTVPEQMRVVAADLRKARDDLDGVARSMRLLPCGTDAVFGEFDVAAQYGAFSPPSRPRSASTTAPGGTGGRSPGSSCAA